MIVPKKAFNDDLAPEGFPCQPNHFAGQPQIIEIPSSYFGIGAREDSLELDFAVVWTEPFDRPLPTSQGMNAQPVAATEAN
jgi:hypothetical protein